MGWRVGRDSSNRCVRLVDNSYMPWLGSILPRSILGPQRADPAKKSGRQKKLEVKRAQFEQDLDEAELSLESVSRAKEVGNTKTVATEEGDEDHDHNAMYGPHGEEAEHADDAGPLDLEA